MRASPGGAYARDACFETTKQGLATTKGGLLGPSCCRRGAGTGYDGSGGEDFVSTREDQTLAGVRCV